MTKEIQFILYNVPEKDWKRVINNMKKTDVTLRITPELTRRAQENLKKASHGHLGTHFDCVGKEFSLENTERKGIVFDVSNVQDRDIERGNIDMSRVEKGSFVIFYSGYIEAEGYGTKKYFQEHPQVSNELIDVLIDVGVALIGADFSGLRNGAEHTPCDLRCANREVFIIENLCNLKDLAGSDDVLIHTYPLNFTGITGLPCMVIAETAE